MQDSMLRRAGGGKVARQNTKLLNRKYSYKECPAAVYSRPKQRQPLQAIKNRYMQSKDGIIDREKRDSITDTRKCTSSEARSRADMQFEMF